MTKQVPWFVEERARCFASLVLTKRDNVKVQPYAGRDTAIDLLVEVLKDGKPTLRFFGVRLIASLDLPDVQDADEPALSDLGTDSVGTALPLCVFAIGVRKLEGAYRWIVEPVVEDGHARLLRNEGTDWQPLDEAGVARLIGQVTAWYDAINGNSTPKSRGRHSKTGS